MWLLIFIVVVIYLLYEYIYKPTLYWKNKEVPHAKPVPVFGNAAKSTFLRESFTDTLKQMYNEFENERYFGIYFFSEPSLCIRDLQLIKQLTIKDFDHFTDHISIIEPEADPFAAKNLLNIRGNEWRQMRSTLSPVFTGSKMRGMYLLMSECARDVTEYLRSKNEETLQLDLKELFTKYTNDVIASTSFGIKCDSLRDEENEFYRMGKILTGVQISALIRICLYLTIPSIMKALKVRVISPEITGFFHRIVSETKKAREEQNIYRPDMLQLLFEAQKGTLKADDEATQEVTAQQPKHKLTDEDITSQALVFFFAGFDTAATALSFMLLELAINPDTQEKLQKEIDVALTGGEINYERIIKMEYLDQVISETLRKWPPAFQTDRVCVKQYTIPPTEKEERSIVLEKGSSITIPIVAIHYDPKYFLEPDKFDPERFSEENKASIVPGSYMPFGVGPRNCIGSRFALLEIKVMAVHLLSKFNVVPTEKTQIPIKITPKSSSLSPEGGFWVGLQPRKVTAL